jgi:hypothetical protein
MVSNNKLDKKGPWAIDDIRNGMTENNPGVLNNDLKAGGKIELNKLPNS